MWPYLCSFSISCGFSFLAEKSLEKRNRKLFLVFSFFSIFVVTLLAGMRSSEVGTDVLTYGNYVFRFACSSSLKGLFGKYGSIMEPFYLVLNFVVSCIYKDVHFFYFIFQFIIMIFIYAALFDNRKFSSLTLGLFIYYTLFYSFALNGMRQSMAMAIVLYATKYIYKADFKRYFIWVIIATGFHYTALLFLLFYFIYLLLDKLDSTIGKIIILTGMIVVALAYSGLIKMISAVFGKYERYIITSGTYSLSLNPLVIRLPILILYIVLNKEYKKDNKQFDFWMVMLLGDVIFSQMRGLMAALYRISLYFGIVKIQAYPYITKVFDNKSRYIVKILLVLYLLIVWYYQVVIQGNDGVYPYISDVFVSIN